MSKIIAVMSISLDGFIADRNDGLAEVFNWNFSGEVFIHPEPEHFSDPGSRTSDHACIARRCQNSQHSRAFDTKSYGKDAAKRL
jgi:hypothetical protein